MISVAGQVGVHSAKFENERDTEAIRNAVLRYGVPRWLLCACSSVRLRSPPARCLEVSFHVLTRTDYPPPTHFLPAGVTHPVVNDPKMKMWGDLRVQSWPTLVVLSPEGKILTYLAGENNEKNLDDIFTAALKYYGAKGKLVFGRVPVSLERDKDALASASPLSYPGKARR